MESFQYFGTDLLTDASGEEFMTYEPQFSGIKLSPLTHVMFSKLGGSLPLSDPTFRFKLKASLLDVSVRESERT